MIRRYSFMVCRCSWFVVADFVVRGSFIVRSKIFVDLIGCWLWFVVRSCVRLLLVTVVVAAVVVSTLCSTLGIFALYSLA